MLPLAAHNNGSYCGNKIVEEGEDCDCGRPEECLAVDKCCVARNDALNIPGCTVKHGKQCRCVIARTHVVIIMLTYLVHHTTYHFYIVFQSLCSI